ncbi:MAG: hypothetical protein ACYSTS_00580 [Planctomycetota bacterium]|jgi:hypothetical protein
MIDLTLTSFIRNECANLIRQNECLGVDTLGKRFRNEGPCYVLEKDACIYFVKAVLPIAKQRGYGNVISQYQRIDINSELKNVKIRNCVCGAEIPKGKQVCEKCRKKKRQKTHREYNLKREGPATTEV